MKNYWFPIILFSAATIFVSCKPEPKPAPLPPTTEAVLIGCEGLAAASTSTMASYDPKGKVLENNIFQKANSYILGNAINSMLVDDDKIFLVLSGEGEIVVVDKDTYKVLRRIKGLGAPRNIMKVGENRYYITDWQLEGIYIYSYHTKSLYTLLTGKGPENMIQYENMAFIANGGDGTADSMLTVINTDMDTILTQIEVGFNPNSLQIDANNKLWVLCSGIQKQNTVNSISGNLVSFNLDQDSIIFNLKTALKIVDSLPITDNQMRPVKLQRNVPGDVLYWLDNKTEANVMRFSIYAASTSTSPYIPGSFYGIAVDPIEGDIYLTDPVDGLQNGDVLRYNDNGAQEDFFKVGIMPGCFGFK